VNSFENAGVEQAALAAAVLSHQEQPYSPGGGHAVSSSLSSNHSASPESPSSYSTAHLQ
jgi:hypothetical protein